ncbi:hypothetical protein [uncultured Methylobacterium sp.]|uniref:hypothetical protein n=1 Tax=uncultured Methylobacterium sp. TaxID=157278 RepID=UPI0035CC6CE8
MTLVSEEDDAEFKALIERYEQLLCDWEHLSHRAIEALSVRSHSTAKCRHALRHP